MERLGIEIDIVDYVEIDAYATKSFNAIHNTNFFPQDIKTWDKEVDVDLIIHGSPCQDFSIAGEQRGARKGGDTQSSLMYESIRIIEKLNPKYVLWENVKNLLSKTHRPNFDNYITTLESLGYRNYFKVLNSKDFGVPQNRERVFTVSIRRDIDKDFQFPVGTPSNNVIKSPFNFGNRHSARRVYDISGLCATLVAAMGNGGGHVPMILDGGNHCLLTPNIKQILEDNVGEEFYIKNKWKEAPSWFNDIHLLRIYKEKKELLSKKVSLFDDGLHQEEERVKSFTIRELTPLECWRLMGYDDEDYLKASEVSPKRHLLKQAGNSIVVNVLEAIFKNLFLK